MSGVKIGSFSPGMSLDQYLLDVLKGKFNIYFDQTQLPQVTDQLENTIVKIKDDILQLLKEKQSSGSTLTISDVNTIIRQNFVDSGLGTNNHDVDQVANISKVDILNNILQIISSTENTKALSNAIYREFLSDLAESKAIENPNSITAKAINDYAAFLTEKDFAGLSNSYSLQSLLTFRDSALSWSSSSATGGTRYLMASYKESINLADGKLQEISQSSTDNYLNSNLPNSNGLDYVNNFALYNYSINAKDINLSTAIADLKTELNNINPNAPQSNEKLIQAKNNLADLLDRLAQSIVIPTHIRSSANHLDDLDGVDETMKASLARFDKTGTAIGYFSSLVTMAGVNRFNIDASMQALNYLLANSTARNNYVTDANVRAILTAADDIAINVKTVNLTFGLFKDASGNNITSFEAKTILDGIDIGAARTALSNETVKALNALVNSYDFSVMGKNFNANLAAIYDDKLLASANKIIAKANQIVANPIVTADAIPNYFTRIYDYKVMERLYASYNLGQDLVDILKDMQKEINNNQDYTLGTTTQSILANGAIVASGLSSAFVANHDTNTIDSNAKSGQRNYIKEVADILKPLFGLNSSGNILIAATNLSSSLYGVVNALSNNLGFNDLLGDPFWNGHISTEERVKYDAIAADVAEISAMFNSQTAATNPGMLKKISEALLNIVDNSAIDAFEKDTNKNLNSLSGLNGNTASEKLKNHYEALLNFVDKYIVDLDTSGSNTIGTSVTNQLLPSIEKFIVTYATTTKEYNDKLCAVEDKIADLLNSNDVDLKGNIANVTTTTTNPDVVVGVYTRFYAGFSFGVKF